MKRPSPRALVRSALAAASLALAGLASSTHAAGLMTPVGGTEPLVLEEQHVEVVVESGFTVTSVEQRFANPHPRDLDALYRFPIPKDAAVGEFTYWIDDVPVHAEVLERKGRARAARNRKGRRARDRARRTGRLPRLRHARLPGARRQRCARAPRLPAGDGDRSRCRALPVPARERRHRRGDRRVLDTGRGGRPVRSPFACASARATRSTRCACPTARATVTDLGSGEWEVAIDATTGSGASVGEGARRRFAPRGQRRRADDRARRDRTAADVVGHDRQRARSGLPAGRGDDRARWLERTRANAAVLPRPRPCRPPPPGGSIGTSSSTGAWPRTCPGRSIW